MDKLKISLYWPDCNRINGKLSNEKIDSFWLECSYEEADEFVFPYMNLENIQISKSMWEKQTSEEDGRKKDILCFLVSRNLSSIYPLPWFYTNPFKWNVDSPFYQIKETD